MLEMDNTEALQGGGGDYTAVAEGLYIARIVSIEAGVKSFKGEETAASVFRFELAQGVDGSPVVDLNGETQAPGARRITKKCNIKSCYIFNGQTKPTNAGQILKAVGVDPLVAKPDVAAAVGKLCIVQVVNWKKENGSQGDAIESVSAFNGDADAVIEKLGPLTVDESYDEAK